MPARRLRRPTHGTTGKSLGPSPDRPARPLAVPCFAGWRPRRSCERTWRRRALPRLPGTFGSAEDESPPPGQRSRLHGENEPDGEHGARVEDDASLWRPLLEPLHDAGTVEQFYRLSDDERGHRLAGGRGDFGDRHAVLSVVTLACCRRPYPQHALGLWERASLSQRRALRPLGAVFPRVFAFACADDCVFLLAAACYHRALRRTLLVGIGLDKSPRAGGGGPG